MLPYLCRRKSGVAVPINILICLVRIDMLAVFNVKSAVIMLGIVNAIFSALPLCLVSFIQSSFPPSSNFLFDGNCRAVPLIFSQSGAWEKGSFAASPADSSVRQYPVWADARITPTGQWLPPLTCTGKLRSLYPSQRMLSTSCTCPAPTEAEHRPCRPLYSRHRIIPFTIPKNGLVKIPTVLQILWRKFLQKKSQFTIHFHWKFFDNWLFRLSCIIFSFTMRKQRRFLCCHCPKYLCKMFYVISINWNFRISIIYILSGCLTHSFVFHPIDQHLTSLPDKAIGTRFQSNCQISADHRYWL